MSGIVGYVGRRQAGPILLDGLKRLEYSGYDWAGLAVGSAKGLFVRRAAGKLRNLEASVRLDPVRGTYGIGHTGWAAQRLAGKAPSSTGGSVAVALNGRPRNLRNLRLKFRLGSRAGAKASNEEILAALIGSQADGGAPLEEAVRLVAREIEGACSFAAVSRQEPGKVVAARRGLATVVGLGQRENFLASGIPAILHRTRDMIQLEDGDVAVLTAGGVRMLDSDARPVGRSVHHVQWDPLMAEKSGYKHFMLKEIFEQPRAIRETTLGRLDEATGKVFLDELGVTVRELRAIRHLTAIGCGSSWHAGLTAKGMIERLARVHVEIEYGSEFRYSNPLIDENVLTLVLSQSGETADILASQQLAHERGSKTIAISNAVDSTLADRARGAIFTKAGPELAAASTKSFIAQLTALFLFAMRLGQARGQLSAARSRKYARHLLQLPELVESALDLTDRCERFARQCRAGKVLFLGRGIHYPIALQGARQLQELARLPAEGCAAGEMRHGPMALVDADLLVVALATVDEEDPGSRLRYEKTVAQVQEVAANQGHVVCIANEGDERLRPFAQEVIWVPPTCELLAPVVELIPLQLLAYHLALLRGRDIDQPRNIARSVMAD